MNDVAEFVSTLGRDIILHGGHSENDNQTSLRAGALSVIYENGNLKYISAGNSEVLRMIYSAVRDREWLTIKPVISDEKIESYSDSFAITYNCRYRSDDVDFLAFYSIRGSADNTIVFSFEGEALNTFEKSRIGFCVLHPSETCAGKSCEIIHTDKSVETLEFPKLIDPDQIFMDIIGMKWKAGDIECMLSFSGDIFETEDQRNWTDASYKTYCTPLALPCPATVEKGSTITQRIELRAYPGRMETEEPADVVTISINAGQKYDLPLVGIGKASGNKKLSRTDASVIRNAGFHHYRADIYLFEDNWKALASEALDEAEILGMKAELAVFTDTGYRKQLTEFALWMKENGELIYAVHVFHKTELATPVTIRESASAILKAAHPGLMTGFGTNANYAELNRDRPGNEDYNFICFSVHPQEHASDNETLTENLWGQAYTVESAKYFSNGKKIWVTPVNIQRRFNANIEAYEQPAASQGLPPQVDSRLMSLYGACWTAGSFKCISEAGASGITFLETAGERGIIQGESDSARPADFMSCSGMIFPVYHFFAWLLADKSAKILKSVSSSPLRVLSLVLEGDEPMKTLLVNFTPDTQKVRMEGINGPVKLKRLDERSFPEAAADPEWIKTGWSETVQFDGHVTSLPYSLLFIESQLISR